MLQSSPFAELFCISDLHLGGRPGFQIFDQGELLAAVVGHLADRNRDKPIVLVINGDFVDFLAEAEGQRIYLDARGAVDKLRRIFEAPAFHSVFTALRTYIGRKNRFLAITLGNHDLELALPEVRTALADLLTAGNPAARGRLHFAFDGTGFSAGVGVAGGPTARVLALHGNEADNINVTDYEALRRVARDLQEGRAPKPWRPNAGTTLVIDLMNDIKVRYPFVDLLKPEFAAMVPILVALDPALLARVRKLRPFLQRAFIDRFRNLGEEEGAADAGADAAEPALAAPPLSTSEIEALYDDIDAWLLDDVEPVALAANQQADLLGPWGLVLDLFRRKDPKENLRTALLRWLDEAPTGLDAEDSVYRELADTVGPSVDVLLTGHTHKPRARLRDDGGLYFNSGSWIDRIELTGTDLEPQRFDRVYEALRSERRAALLEVDGLVRRQPVVVHVSPQDGAVMGRLCVAARDGTDVVLQPLGDPLEVRS